jgi:hypothetical protein
MIHRGRTATYRRDSGLAGLSKTSFKVEIDWVVKDDEGTFHLLYPMRSRKYIYMLTAGLGVRLPLIRFIDTCIP